MWRRVRRKQLRAALAQSTFVRGRRRRLVVVLCIAASWDCVSAKDYVKTICDQKIPADQWDVPTTKVCLGRGIAAVAIRLRRRSLDEEDGC